MTAGTTTSARPRRFISTEVDPPPGFERVEAIGRRDLRAGIVAIWTLDPQALMESLQVPADSMTGLLLCPAGPEGRGERERLGVALWRVSVGVALMPMLREVADAWLDPCAELRASLGSLRKAAIEREREQSDRQRLIDKVDQETKDLRKMLLDRTKWTAEAMTSLVRFSAERLSQVDAGELPQLVVQYLTGEALGYRAASIWRRDSGGVWRLVAGRGDEVAGELTDGRAVSGIEQPNPATMMVPIAAEGLDLLAVHTAHSFDEATRSFLSLCSLLVSAAMRSKRLNDALEEAVVRKDVLIQELSVPIIQVWHDTVCLPVIGSLDRARAADIADSLLAAVAKIGLRYVIIDFTGLAVMDAETVRSFAGLAQAIRLLGAECMLSGISPRIAMAMVELDVEISEVATLCSVEAAIAKRLESRPGVRRGHGRAARG